MGGVFLDALRSYNTCGIRLGSILGHRKGLRLQMNHLREFTAVKIEFMAVNSHLVLQFMI